jgi:hypothetical protein
MTGNVSLIDYSLLFFQILRAIARGANQRRSCRDHISWDALDHILEATFFCKGVHKAWLLQQGSADVGFAGEDRTKISTVAWHNSLGLCWPNAASAIAFV